MKEGLKTAGLVIISTICCLGLILPVFMDRDIKDEDNGQCQIRMIPYDDMRKVKSVHDYTLIKITDSKYPYLVFAKNCDNQIRIHSDFIMKEEKE